MFARKCLAFGIVAAAVPIVGAVASVASAAPPTSIDLSAYVRIGRYDLPEPTRTSPPVDSLLAQEVSAVTYNPVTDTLFVIGDGSTSIVQLSKTGELIDSMTLALGASPQGTEFYDTEGLTYVTGGNQFILVEERDRQVSRFTYVAGSTLTRGDVQTVDLGTFQDNTGIEGIANDPLTGGIVAVKETLPQGVFQTGLDFGAGSATNGSAATVNSIDLFDPTLAGVSDFADVFALASIPSLAGQPQEGNLLLLSQEAGKIVNIDRAGNIANSLTIVSDPGNPLSVPNQQHEGLTMDSDGVLYVVSENGGGDIDHPQLWVYAPSAVPNQAPTTVSLVNQTSTVLENTSTATRLKVADVSISDDGLGTNNLSVSGADAASFEVDSNGLYITAGTVLDFETKSGYSVTVDVDDPTVGAAPDASSAPFVLTLTDVVDETTSLASLIISEVSPWSSGSSPYLADWFEITNTGTTVVDITGWKVDDNSNAFANAVALSGVTSIAPGQSVVFLEGDATKAAALEAAWFGGATPAGFMIGTYSGGGVGLSTGGDAVNLFDAAGNRVTGAAFGIATTGYTFDNTVGVGSTVLPLPIVATTSVAGVNGAFLAADGIETGSPGSKASTLFVSEVAPWGSGTATYAADWFEVTNFGASRVDISGWKMDDNSNSPVGAVALTGVSSIAPGQSVIFLEGDATKAAAFVTAWFGGTAPAGFAIGTYSGSGVGLSTGSDGVNLFNSAGQRVTGVNFAAATTGVSFDNAARAIGAISTSSVVGINGAYLSPAGETGSPGTIEPDTIAPVVAYSGNAGNYTVDQQVAITCTATDEPAGSGVATTTCAAVVGAAHTFGLGAREYSATATDNAGNTGTASVSFTVTVTPASLCNLTAQMTHESPSYMAMTARQKAAFDRASTALCSATVGSIRATTHPVLKRLLIALYSLTVRSYASTGLLSPVQATTLTGFAATL
ncbi:MAG: SdiA-regulated domain-containing protein [Actinomycetota bacterium]|nr:SdiA-regulated domain-containing protein [Actinomycetota bacterium]